MYQYLNLTLGKGESSSNRHVVSVCWFEWKSQIYVLASGNTGDADVFRLADFEETTVTSKLIPALFWVYFF